MTVKISELTALTTAASGDLLPIVDLTAEPDETKKITVSDLLNSELNASFGTISATGEITANSNSKIGGNSNGSIELGNSTASAGTTTPFIDFHYSVGASQDYNVRVINDGDETLEFRTANNANVLVINGSDIGIGTGSPGGYRLHVLNSTSALLKLSNTGGATSRSRTLEVTSAGRLDIVDLEASVQRMSIDVDGNVGVGTTNPATRFHVTGPITQNGIAIFGRDTQGATFTYASSDGSDTDGEWQSGQLTQIDEDGVTTKLRYDSANDYRLDKTITTSDGVTETLTYTYNASDDMTGYSRSVA